MSSHHDDGAPLICRDPALELEIQETLENLTEFTLSMSFRASLDTLTILSIEVPPAPRRPRPRAGVKRAPVLRMPQRRPSPERS